LYAAYFVCIHSSVLSFVTETLQQVDGFLLNIHNSITPLEDMLPVYF